MKDKLYLHGYSDEEQNRLIDQNDILAQFIYQKIDLSQMKHLVEIGSGVGAQMVKVLNNYPDLKVTGIEISDKQIEKAKLVLGKSGHAMERYDLICSDARKTTLPTSAGFDAAILVWVLEHIPNPIEVLVELNRILNPNSPVFITEVFNNSLNFYPSCPAAMEYWAKVNSFQESIGGDGSIGLQLGNLLSDAGFKDVQLESFAIHFDKTQPAKRKMMLAYWLGLMESSLDNLLKSGHAQMEDWVKAKTEIEGLLDRDDGIFYYSFLQAFARSEED